MSPKIVFTGLLFLAAASYLPAESKPTEERGPLPPPDLSLTRASTIIHPDETKTVTLYDASTRKSDVHYFNSDGTWRAHIIYTLDENGQIKSGQFLDQKDKPGVRSLYRYDDSNRAVEETHYNQAGQLVRRMVYEYGFSNQVMKTVAYDNQGNVLGVWRPTKRATGQPTIKRKR